MKPDHHRPRVWVVGTTYHASAWDEGMRRYARPQSAMDVAMCAVTRLTRAGAFNARGRIRNVITGEQWVVTLACVGPEGPTL